MTAPYGRTPPSDIPRRHFYSILSIKLVDPTVLDPDVYLCSTKQGMIGLSEEARRQILMLQSLHVWSLCIQQIRQICPSPAGSLSACRTEVQTRFHIIRYRDLPSSQAQIEPCISLIHIVCPGEARVISSFQFPAIRIDPSRLQFAAVHLLPAVSY